MSMDPQAAQKAKERVLLVHPDAYFTWGTDGKSSIIYGGKMGDTMLSWSLDGNDDAWLKADDALRPSETTAPSFDEAMVSDAICNMKFDRWWTMHGPDKQLFDAQTYTEKWELAHTAAKNAWNAARTLTPQRPEPTKLLSAAKDVVDYWENGGYKPGIESRLTEAVRVSSIEPTELELMRKAFEWYIRRRARDGVSDKEVNDMIEFALEAAREVADAE